MDMELRNDRIPRNPFDRQFLDMENIILGWVCIPLVVESYGAWGKEALEAFSTLASRLATSSSRPKSMVLSELYGRLNLHLVRTNVRAILCRLSCHHQEYI